MKWCQWQLTFSNLLGKLLKLNFPTSVSQGYEFKLTRSELLAEPWSLVLYLHGRVPILAVSETYSHFS